MAPVPPLASAGQILATPSGQDGLPPDLEDDLRTVGCMMIQEAGIMLGLPQSTMGTAQVIFQRFYYVSSMHAFGVNDLSVSCLYLATKLNESPVRLRDLINTYMFLQARVRHILSQPADTPLCARGARPALSARMGNPARDAAAGAGGAAGALWDGFAFDVPSFHSTVFWEWKDAIQYNELQVLKRLGFTMQVDLPYSHVINYLKILDLVFEDDIAQLCWSILNDALLTPLYAQQPTHVLAVASILLATRLRHIPLPDDWYLLFDVTWEDIWPCCGTIMLLWRNWGTGTGVGCAAAGDAGAGAQEDEDAERARENRWRRAWILAESRKAVRKWIEERSPQEGE